MNLVTELLYKNQSIDKKIAFIEHGSSITYEKFKRKIYYLKEILFDIGIEPGDQIVILEPISANFYEMLLAAWLLNVEVVIFDPTATPNYIDQCLDLISAKFFLGSRNAWLLRMKLPKLREIKNSFVTDSIFRMADVLEKNNGNDPEWPNYQDKENHYNDPALITFTSGSQGRPKAVVRTQGFLLQQFKTISITMPFSSQDVDYAVLPVFTLANVGNGITTYMPHKKRNKRNTISELKEMGVNRITASPSVVLNLAKAVTTTNRETEFEKIYLGGGPIYPSTLTKIQAAFPVADISLVYGSTEVEPIAMTRDKDITLEIIAKMRSGAGLFAGKIVNGIECRILPLNSENNDTGDFSLSKAKRVVGEIVVSGKNVLPGYLGGIGDQDTKFRISGTIWHKTGDLGYFDENGALWLLGRKTEIFSDANGIVYPLAMETWIIEKYKVNHMAVLHDKNKRIVVIESGKEMNIDINGIKKDCKADKIVVLKHFPMDVRHHSKINYNKLKTLVLRSR